MSRLVMARVPLVWSGAPMALMADLPIAYHLLKDYHVSPGSPE